MDIRTIESLIDTELGYRYQQSTFFQHRQKEGPIVTPEVWVPCWDPAGLGAIFIEPGAFHLVFRDEVAPQSDFDKAYRARRQEIYGRTTDVESVEVIQGPEVYKGRQGILNFIPKYTRPEVVSLLNNASGINIYETSMHFAMTGPWERRIYSNTWNHMLGTKQNLAIRARGGYIMALPVIIDGDREEAEQWLK